MLTSPVCRLFFVKIKKKQKIRTCKQALNYLISSIYSIIAWYVATVAGEDLFKCLNIKYLNKTSNKTGKVATNKNIPVWLSGRP